MLSLGDKQRVLNTNADVSFFDPTAGTVRATTGAIIASDSFNIKGFGTFNIGDITDIKLKRAKAAVAESKEYTVVAPTGVAIGEAIEVKIRMKTNRYQGELANNYIGGAKPLVFMTAPLTAVTAAAIRTAIVAGYAAYQAAFVKADLTLSVSAGVAATDVLVTPVAGYESVEVVSVEIRRAVGGAGNMPFITLVVGVLNASGDEGRGLGKFLEESVRMGTAANSMPYGIDTADTRVDLRGSYTEVYFKVSAPYADPISSQAADHGPLPAQHSFTIFLNESTCIASNGAIEKLAQAAVFVGAALPNVSTTAISAPLTRAQEEVEALVIATDDSVATAANFIA